MTAPLDPTARWPIDENGRGPFGWRGNPRAAVGVPCNVCRNQPEALPGLRMCMSCMWVAAEFLTERGLLTRAALRPDDGLPACAACGIFAPQLSVCFGCADRARRPAG